MANGDTTPVTHSYLHNKMEQVREIMDGTLIGMTKSIDENKEANNKSHEHIRTDIRELRAGDKQHTQDIGVMRISITRMETDVNWIKKFFWIIAASSIGAMTTGIITMVITYQK